MHSIIINFKCLYTPFSRSPNYIHLPLAVDHCLVCSFPSAAAVNGLVKNAFIVLSSTLKSSVFAQIYNICRPDSGSDKIGRFRNAAVIDDNLFYLLLNVHSLTFFHCKI